MLASEEVIQRRGVSVISIQIAGVVIDVVQTYIILNFICRLWKPRYGVVLTNSLIIGISIFVWLKQAYRIESILGDSPIILISINIISLVAYIYLLIESSLWKSIKRGILVSFFLLLSEICMVFLIRPLFSYDLFVLQYREGTVLIKIIYTLIVYFEMLTLESIIYWKRNKKLNSILISYIIFVVCEFAILMTLVNSMGREKIKYLVVISSMYSFAIILSYFIMINVGEEIIRQEKKKNEIERSRLEKQYQYDYYILAKEKAEQVRDLRHDMRNQLQTVQYLISSETEDEKNHAREMLKNLEEKVEKLMMEEEQNYT